MVSVLVAGEFNLRGTRAPWTPADGASEAPEFARPRLKAFRLLPKLSEVRPKGLLPLQYSSHAPLLRIVLGVTARQGHPRLVVARFESRQLLSSPIRRWLGEIF